MTLREVRLYKVEFLNYTDDTKETIYAEVGPTETSYIHIPAGGLIVREDTLEFYRFYGGGFKSLTFVGYMLDMVDE